MKQMRPSHATLAAILLSLAAGCASSPVTPCEPAAAPASSEIISTPAAAEAQRVEVESAPLSLWNDTAHKRAILNFVQRVTDTKHADYVPKEERIAVFDNDGTLWIEQPLYVQLAFAIDQVKAMAKDHPEWKKEQPFKAIIEDDHEAFAMAGEKGLFEVLTATHSNMSEVDFAKLANEWLSTAKHPKYNRPYTELVYAPMVELLSYLREHDFKTYIVSGGGVSFMRVFTEKVYGVPPEQVIGSQWALEYSAKESPAQIRRGEKLYFVDDKEGKPIAIQRQIGRRPIFAFGNSDGDLAMLKWTTAGEGARFGGIVKHTDDAREYKYDRESHIGRLDKAQDEAESSGWFVIDMKNDWKTVFAP